MRNKFRLGAVVVFLLAVASITVASASSSSGNSGDRGKRSVEVIHLTAQTVEETELDLNPDEMFGQGDKTVFTEDLFRNGKKVGIDGGEGTVVRAQMGTVTLQFLVTLRLPKGQITVQGLADFTEQGAGGPFRLAITGGTGKYRTAHGELTVTEISETELRLKLRIIR
jgi:Allene oxide cyclase barrel like domain